MRTKEKQSQQLSAIALSQNCIEVHVMKSCQISRWLPIQVPKNAPVSIYDGSIKSVCLSTFLQPNIYFERTTVICIIFGFKPQLEIIMNDHYGKNSILLVNPFCAKLLVESILRDRWGNDCNRIKLYDVLQMHSIPNQIYFVRKFQMNFKCLKKKKNKQHTSKFQMHANFVFFFRFVCQFKKRPNKLVTVFSWRK